MIRRALPPLALLGTVSVAILLSGCSGNVSAEGAVATPSSVQVPSASTTAAPDGSETPRELGEPSGLWTIPREVQVAYFKALCTAPAEKFGYAGTYDNSTGKCLTSNDMESDVDFLMRGLLASDEKQMGQAIALMLSQVGEPVSECPASMVSGNSSEAPVTNDCLIAAMKALAAHLTR